MREILRLCHTILFCFFFFIMYMCICASIQLLCTLSVQNEKILSRNEKKSLRQQQQQQEGRKIAILHVFPNMTLKILLTIFFFILFFYIFLHSESRVVKEKKNYLWEGENPIHSSSFSFTQWKTLEGYKCDNDEDDNIFLREESEQVRWRKGNEK